MSIPFTANSISTFTSCISRGITLNLDPDKLNTYAVFSAALDDLITRLGVKGKMNYLHLRKFGWLYIDHVVKESMDEKVKAT